MITVIAFVLVLSVLVLIHEFGHFIVAKKLGIKVEEFGFGFPPRVLWKKIGETIYSINLLPFGGFVKLYGEDAAGAGKLRIRTRESRLESQKLDAKRYSLDADTKRAFFARPPWQRLSIVLAGVVMNFILAVGLISYLFASQGVAVPTDTVRVVEILPNSPAEKEGLRKDDIVVSINNKKITETKQFIDETKKHLAKKIELKIRRKEKIVAVSITPREKYPKGEGPIGVAISNIEVKRYTWYQAPVFGTYEAARFSFLIIQGIGKLLFDFVFQGIKPEGVAGPVGVAQLAGQAVQYGVFATMWFVALLSLNLAVLNVLPIPALDGGRLFFILIELVTRKKVHPRYEALAHAIGLAILLALMALITFQDIARVLSGKSILTP